MEFDIVAPILIRTTSEPVKATFVCDSQIRGSMDDLAVEYECLLKNITKNVAESCVLEDEQIENFVNDEVDEYMSKIREEFEAKLRDIVVHEQAKCAVCLTMHEVDYTCKACVNTECSAQVCHGCLYEYISTVVRDAQYTMPPIRCIGCKHHVPTQVWVTCLQKTKSDLEVAPLEHKIETLLNTYITNGFAFFSMRCAACDRTFPLIADHTPTASDIMRELTVWTNQPGLKHTLANFKEDTTIVKLFLQYIRGEVVADAVIAAMESILLSQLDLDADSIQCLLEVGQMPTHLCGIMEDLFMMVRDIERRLALHTALLKRYPKIFTHCCNCEHCFRCGVVGFHEEMSCEEKQRELMSLDIQFCPSCEVPTVRTEGCTSVTCVCTFQWTWEENLENDEDESATLGLFD